MSFVPPCRRPQNDPNDWFIERDGRQYHDEPLVPMVTLEAMVASLKRSGVDVTDEAYEELKARLEADAKTTMLIRRRKAKDLCHTDCIQRLECLGVALGGNDQPAAGLGYGTWGGYYQEELRAIDSERRRRKSVRRLGVD